MVVRQHTERGLRVLAPAGEVDVYTVGGLRDALSECLAAGDLRIVVDLTDVTFMDSSGLGVLVGGLKKVNSVGGSLRLVGPSSMLRRMLKTTGLTRVFDLYDSLADLLATEPAEALD
ncbi:STAS domain-containing protein [Nocardioides panacis]|uniref:STAS domain-containing protein n=1 Tax=Nocardioides panacis TaxID=2849501 RepID=A0A975T203_9ACTN|nr:STAS domain-containing protein [Nocardioides panacis]QWZ10076.1 STAS domain-containing protein [Nocardioides panacis]